MSDLVRVSKGLAFQPQSTNPLVEAGDIYFDSATKLFYYFDGVSTLPVGGTTLSNTTPAPVGPVGAPGVTVTASRSDHVHAGAHSVNSVLGDVNILSGAGINVTTVGQNITIASTGGGGTEFDAGSVSTTTFTVDWANSSAQRVEIRSNTVISMINGNPGQLNVLKVFYDISGGYIVSFDASKIYWKNNILPGNTGVAYTYDLFYFYLGSDGNYYGFDEQNYQAIGFYGAQNIALCPDPNTVNVRNGFNFVTYDGNTWFPWGQGNNGQLGVGSTNNIQAPHISSPISGRSFTSITGASQTAMGLETGTGNVYAWGSNGSGQLGNNSIAAASSPVSVFGGRSFTQLVFGAVAPGGSAVGLEGSTGLAWCWGFGANGQLGNNSTGNQSSPVSVLGGRSWKWVSSGGDTKAAIEGSTGNAYCWGENNFGQHGNSSQNNSSSPVSVFGGRSFTKIFTGAGQMTIAIEGATGAAWAWGTDTTGQLGDNQAILRSSPVSVVGGRSWATMALTGDPTVSNVTVYALEASTGNAYAWGAVDNGDGISLVNRSSPAIISTRSFSKLSASIQSAVAVEGGTGTMYLFGQGTGIAGVYDFPNSGSWNNQASVPVIVNPALWKGKSFSQIIGVANLVVGIQTNTGNAYAWGAGGNLGNSTLNPASAPISVLGGRSYSKMALSNVGNAQLTAVALIEGGTGNLYAWGTGSLGNGVTTSASSPVSVLGGRSYSQIAGQNQGTGFCAIQGNTGNAYSWGSNVTGVLGINSIQPQSSPVSVVGAKSFKRIAGCQAGFAALEGSTGFAWAWGQNAQGQVGDNTTTPRSSPVLVVGARSFNEIAGYQGPNGFANAGESFCALEGSTGRAYCWGNNSSGTLGNNSGSSSSSPVSVLGGRSFTKIVCGIGGYMAIEGSTGFIYGWGGEGLVGDGGSILAVRSSPVLVAGGRSYTNVFSAGGDPVRFAIDANNNTYFWGSTVNAQAGNVAGGQAFNSPISIGRISYT